MLSDRNVDLLVNKISQMRGAALKMGQMLSIQGIQAASDKESWIPPQMEQILLKVHDSANYMPQKQMEVNNIIFIPKTGHVLMHPHLRLS